MPEDYTQDGNQTVDPYRAPVKFSAREEETAGVEPYGYVYYEKPERHGCLTAWFTVSILSDIYSIAIAIAVIPFRAFPHHIPIVTLAVLFFVILCCGVKIGSVNALFHWRRWGFYGWLSESIALFVLVILLGLNPIPALWGLIGVFILYKLLRTGSRRSVWNALK